jgi:hypothetical protein
MSNTKKVEVQPDQEYTIKFRGVDLANIEKALQEIPAKFANPIIQSMTEQVVKQVKIVPSTASEGNKNKLRRR